MADLPGDCQRPSILASAISIIIVVFVLSYFSFKFMKVDDPYFCSIFQLGQLFIIITYPMAPEMYYPWFDFRWLSVPVSLLLTTFNGLFPVLLTFDSFRVRLESQRFKLMSHEQRQEIDTTGTIFALKQGVDIFQAVLDHPLLLEAFTEFSVKEWSVENVLFYQTVKDFKDHFEARSQNSASTALRIITEYIKPGAPMEIDLDHSVRKDFTEAQTNPQPDMFDEPQRLVFNLMKNDTFAKWQKTVDFKAALERVVSHDTESGSRT